jgi:hypothetical protein
MPAASPLPAGQPPSGARRSLARRRASLPSSSAGRASLAAGAAAAVALAAVAAAVPASAAAQPHLAAASQPRNFTVGRPAAYPGTAVIAANGTAYLAYSAYTTKAETFVSAWLCVLPRGARKCKTTTLLRPLDSATKVSNQPDSIVLGPDGTVDVLVTTDSDANGGDRTGSGAEADTLEYVLTAAGKLSSVTRVGTLDQQGTAIRVGGQLLWTSGGDSATQGGVSIQETPADGTFPNLTSPVQLNLAGTAAASEVDFDGTSAVPLPGGNVLLAWDNGTNAYAAEVSLGSDDIVRSAEFKTEVTTDNFGGPAGALVTGRSGIYLVTRASNDGFGGRLEVHKYLAGSGALFAAARKAPTTTADYGDFKLSEDGQGKLSIYYETSDVLVQDTSTDGGAHWSVYRYASQTPEVTPNIAPALTASGAGVVLEAAGGTVSNGILPRVQPVWVHQSVSFRLAKSRLHHGGTTTGSGRVSYPDGGQKVILQRDTSHGWVTVSTGHTSASGAYSFTVHAGSSGTTRYRVAAAEVKGWFFTDYSGTHTVDVS